MLPSHTFDLLREIQLRHAKSLDMNSASVQKQDGSLYYRSRRLFGSWDEALLAAGLDPRALRKIGGGQVQADGQQAALERLRVRLESKKN